MCLPYRRIVEILTERNLRNNLQVVGLTSHRYLEEAAVNPNDIMSPENISSLDT